jgi:hypothetical protein
MVYPETEGWDILLVRVSDGFQIGIQAKLALNIGVINQCLEHGQTTCEVLTAVPSSFRLAAAETSKPFASTSA